MITFKAKKIVLKYSLYEISWNFVKNESNSYSVIMGPLEPTKYGEQFHELYINCLDNR